MAHLQKFKAAAIGNMTGHYERVFEQRGYERENIDISRTSENYNLAPNRGNQARFIEKRIEELNLKRIRKDAVRMCDWVITQPKDLEESESRKFFESCYKHLEGLYGKENVVSSFVHLDESQPHMHFAFIPVTEDGRLSAKDLLNRNHLKGFHEALKSSVEFDLGHEVSITLTDDQRASRELEYMDIKSFKETTQRLENLRQEERRITGEIEKLESIPTSWSKVLEIVGSSRRRAQELGERIRAIKDEIVSTRLAFDSPKLQERLDRFNYYKSLGIDEIGRKLEVVRESIGKFEERTRFFDRECETARERIAYIKYQIDEIGWKIDDINLERQSVNNSRDWDFER